jgi:ElaB/YqjD/DUF883 family membrane-anchored ribosome-binding protein
VEKEANMDNEVQNEAMTQDTETLKADIEKLRNDLGEMLGSIGTYSKEKIMDTQNRLRTAVEDIQGRTKARLHSTSQIVREKGQMAMEKSRKGIEHRPLTAMAVAFCSGMALASILHRR